MITNAFRDQSILLSDTAYVRPKAFSNIRIQDRNTFLCAENAMNIQAREGVRHGANCIQDRKFHNINLQRSFAPRSHRASHRIGPHTRTGHTVPYGTARLGRAVPGTSCQATIMRSLRDILPVALTPPHAHGTALIAYQTVSYTCGAATLRACVPGVRTGLPSFTTRRLF